MVLGYLEDLTSFGPRVTETSACHSAGDYIFDEFQAMGLDVRYHHWSSGSWADRNIEATLHGSDPLSDEIYIICAHYDTVPGSPGADDNASGTAAVLSAADVMSGYAFKHTIRFVAFSGEEEGLLGSHEYVEEAYAAGDNIVATLNADMIGFALTPGDETQVNAYANGASVWLRDYTSYISTLYHEYVDLTVIPRGQTSGSDHYYFWASGYDALFYAEYHFNPYWHYPEDIIANMNLTYDMKTTRLIFATLAELAELDETTWGACCAGGSCAGVMSWSDCQILGGMLFGGKDCSGVVCPTDNTSCSGAAEIACDNSVMFDNSGISNPANPSYGCGSGGSHDGTLWFKFTPGHTNVRIATCDSPASDSTFAVYESTCGSLVEIACGEDDGCSLHSDICVGGLSPEETYYVQMSARTTADRGTYNLEVTCPCCFPSSAPEPEMIVDEEKNLAVSKKNRFLSFAAGDAGQYQRIRVKFLDLAPPYDQFNDNYMWVGAPFQVSESPAHTAPRQPGYTDFWAAKLSCEKPFPRDWTELTSDCRQGVCRHSENAGQACVDDSDCVRAIIHVYGEFVVPESEYEIRVLESLCPQAEIDNDAFAPPLELATSMWGDVCGLFSAPNDVWTAPDGQCSVPSDVIAVLWKVALGPLSKTRGDVIGPEVPKNMQPDLEVTIPGDVIRVLSACAAHPFPADTPAWPCQ